MTWPSPGDYPHPMFGWYAVQKCSPPSQLRKLCKSILVSKFPIALTSFGTTWEINFIFAQSFLSPSSYCLVRTLSNNLLYLNTFFRICFQGTHTKTSQIEKWRVWFFSVCFIWCQVYNRLNRNCLTHIYTHAHTCINKYIPY